jgi:dihydrofolate reductase
MSLTIIVAMDAAHGIGIQNRLPWHLPEDLAHFKRQTSGHPIIMGRKTYESIGRPLPKRRNIVISRNPLWRADGVECAVSLADACRLTGDETAFVIGGAQIYAQVLPLVQRLLITEIEHRFECDTFFPAIDSGQWRETGRESHQTPEFDYAFVEYQRQ